MLINDSGDDWRRVYFVEVLSVPESRFCMLSRLGLSAKKKNKKNSLVAITWFPVNK